MKMTNEEMRKSIEALNMAQETGKLGYAIARNLRKLRDAAKEYIDIYEGLLKEHATQSKTPGRYILTPEAQEKIEAGIAEFKDIESDVDVFTVDEETFCSGELKSNQMSVLLWMVEEK